ncbi:MAG: alanyl-tRNA editing protein [Candidatus Aenigmarchaeota archaeon]|nr:alanyl-tRNA editing protein [Candidatus Aenigmarchaeota archaeon]
MTTALYLADSYAKECSATVLSVKDGKFIVLDQTIFYPKSGGQANDEGIMKTADGREVKVIFVGKFDVQISHQVEPENVLKESDKVTCTIDWERRYKLMRMHTAAHLLSAIMYANSKVMITGNELQPDQSRMDFDFEKMDAELMKQYISKANDAIKKNIPVKTCFLPRGEALKIPGVVKLANVLPPEEKELRIVEIEGIDVQADGGTHVNNLSEIGEIVFLKVENKGKGRKRVYYTIKL